MPFNCSCAPEDWLHEGTEWLLLAANNIWQTLLAAPCTLSLLQACSSVRDDTVATCRFHSLRYLRTSVWLAALTPRLPVFSLNLLPPFIAPKRGRAIFLGLLSASRLWLPLLIKNSYKEKQYLKNQTGLIYTYANPLQNRSEYIKVLLFLSDLHYPRKTFQNMTPPYYVHTAGVRHLW